MSQIHESACHGYTASEAIAKHLRVILNSDGELEVAGIDEADIGTAENPAFADQDEVTVRLRTAQGTCKAVASEAFDAGAQLYTAASGKVSDTNASGSLQFGTALEEAGANNDVVEVLRHAGGF